MLIDVVTKHFSSEFPKMFPLPKNHHKMEMDYVSHQKNLRKTIEIDSLQTSQTSPKNPLKFNSSPLKNDAWKMILSFWVSVTLQGRSVKLQGGPLAKIRDFTTSLR